MGVQQVGEAVTQMDQTTQQNAALVEEMAAAASSLKSQAQELVQVVAAFKVDGGAHASPAPKMHVRPPMATRPPTPLHKPAAAPKLGSTKPKLAAAKPRPISTSATTALPKPMATARAKPTPAGGDDDWETF
jgi:hypothetical protein